MRHAFFVVVAVLGVYLGTSRCYTKLYNCALAHVYVCTLPPLVVQLVHIFDIFWDATASSFATHAHYAAIAIYCRFSSSRKVCCI